MRYEMDRFEYAAEMERSMKTTSKKMTPADKMAALARALAVSGIEIPEIEVRTPDGRTWTIVAVKPGRGRMVDRDGERTGAWGPVPGAPGGFRLIEFDLIEGDGPNQLGGEHDAVDDDVWQADDVARYLRAVGQPR